MDKYIEMLSAVGSGYLHIAKAFATDNGCPMIEPAHLLRALLHKDMGLMPVYREHVGFGLLLSARLGGCACRSGSEIPLSDA